MKVEISSGGRSLTTLILESESKEEQETLRNIMNRGRLDSFTETLVPKEGNFKSRLSIWCFDNDESWKNYLQWRSRDYEDFHPHEPREHVLEKEREFVVANALEVFCRENKVSLEDIKRLLE